MAVNGKIVHLRADPELVSTLEELLEEARRGEFRTLAYVKVDKNGDPGVFWCCDSPRDTHSFTAGIGDLFFRVFARRFEQATDTDDDDDDDTVG